MANVVRLRLMSPDDKDHLQKKKIAKIQAQIGQVEYQMMKQSSVLDRLEHLQDVEHERTRRIMDRLGKRNYVINNEVERLYGRDPSRKYNDSPLETPLVKDIMFQRNKEHSLAQQDHALRTQYLNIERQRIQDARQRIRERRNNLAYAPSPVGKETLRAWGDKYDIYTPLGYDALLDIYSPRYSECEPFLPRVSWATGRRYAFFNNRYCRAKYRRNKPRYLAVPAGTIIDFPETSKSLDLW